MSRQALTAPRPQAFDAVDAARLQLLRRLGAAGYGFMPPAPTSHRRILLRRGAAKAADLQDVFGWNLTFEEAVLDSEMFGLMHAGQMLARRRSGWVATLRVASLSGGLYLHSGYHRRRRDAVFFGPDTYRFAEFIRENQPRLPPGALIVDIGAGSGAGGLFAQSRAAGARLILSDVNPLALRLAAVNARAAGVEPQLQLAPGMGHALQADLIVANPPFVAGAHQPIYSRGGGSLGEALSLQWAREAAARLAPGGTLLLYTGSAIVRGADGLRRSLAQIAAAADCAFSYHLIDPDIFPELLLHPAYWGVDRIAAVGAVLTRGR